LRNIPVPVPATTTAKSSGKYAGGAREEHRGSYSGGREEDSHSHQYKGKGKGLSHFRRIPVGIEDDRDFRVVQRLIGPRGKHMQDIVVESGGAKVWIIGQGSRSWEDSAGPLTVCVGAASRPVFDIAVTLIQELLDRVHSEHDCKHRR